MLAMITKWKQYSSSILSLCFSSCLLFIFPFHITKQQNWQILKPIKIFPFSHPHCFSFKFQVIFQGLLHWGEFWRLKTELRNRTVKWEMEGNKSTPQTTTHSTATNSITDSTVSQGLQGILWFDWKAQEMWSSGWPTPSLDMKTFILFLLSFVQGRLDIDVLVNECSTYSGWLILKASGNILWHYWKLHCVGPKMTFFGQCGNGSQAWYNKHFLWSEWILGLDTRNWHHKFQVLVHMATLHCVSVLECP